MACHHSEDCNGKGEACPAQSQPINRTQELHDRLTIAYRLGRERATREIRATGFARAIRPVDPVAFRTFGATYMERFERGYHDGAKAAR